MMKKDIEGDNCSTVLWLYNTIVLSSLRQVIGHILFYKMYHKFDGQNNFPVQVEKPWDDLESLL